MMILSLVNIFQNITKNWRFLSHSWFPILLSKIFFKGDYLSKDVELPEAAAGDILIIHDSGAYTMALYSHYNSILPSPIYGYTMKDDGTVEFICFKERETYEENMAFWGSPEPRLV